MFVWLLILAGFVCLKDSGVVPSVATAAEPAGISSESNSPDTSESHQDGQHDETANAKTRAADDEQVEGHSDPVAPVLLAIIVILFFAKVGGDLFERLGLPAVLGELTVGVILGNFAMLCHWHGFDFLHPDNPTGQMLDILARIGVVLLLFEVGLESQVREMMSVGISSLLVAVLGVIAPIALGWAVGWWLVPEQGWQAHAFIGATLCATSVGITARVLKDIGCSQRTESRIILGAAVIDDVLGLIVLAIISGVIIEGEVSVLGLTKIVGLSFGFLAGALFLGVVNFPRFLFRSASFLRGRGLLVVTALVICFGFAYAANLVGLAPIIGAFAAGLILDGANYRDVGRWKNSSLEEALAPLSALLVPIFFVEMGIQVDLNSFRDPSVWGLAAALTVVAIIGKQACSLGVLEGGLNKIAVGLGMIPRGEVGLIFANEGRKLVADGEPVIEPGTYSAIVVMVMLTTMVTPPLLKWSLSRDEKSNADADKNGPPAGSSEATAPET